MWICYSDKFAYIHHHRTRSFSLRNTEKVALFVLFTHLFVIFFQKLFLKLVNTATSTMPNEHGLNINKEWRKLNVGKLYSWYFYEVMIMRWFRTIFSIPSKENIIIEFEIRFCSPRIFQLNNTQIFVKLKQK